MSAEGGHLDVLSARLRRAWRFFYRKIGLELSRKSTIKKDFLPIVPEGLELGLDLGCGSAPKNPFALHTVRGFDLRANPDQNVFALDLSASALPVKNDSVDLVTVFDFLEHVPRWERSDGKVRFPFVELMSEIYRVLKPGGFLFSRTPAFPSPEAFQDPTHVNYITEETFRKYFSGPNWAVAYGFQGQFELVKEGWDGGHLLTMLRKPDRNQTRR